MWFYHCQSKNVCINRIMLYSLGPAPPLNITVVERNVPFVSVRWTAPNDSNKDSYRYHVELYRNTRLMYGTTVNNTEVTITRLAPGRNYTLTVTSDYNGKYSQPATISFTTGPCGGKLRAEGWLSSPGYPQYIYSTTDCVWDIEAPLGHVVFLTVVDLHYYYNYSPLQCNWAWLAVGYNQTSQRDITMCHHSDVGRTIESPSNTLRVFYQVPSYFYRMRRFNVTLSSQDGCIPAQLKVVSYNITSVTLSWIVPNDLNNTFLSFVSLFSSGKEIQNHTTKSKEITITGLSPDSSYSVSISSLCNGTESIPARIGVQKGPPSPPMNLTVVEKGVGFAFVRWTAPNDPNKDNYTYHVAWYQYEYRKYSRTVHGTEINITSLAPGENYTVAVTSSYNNKYSQPATITFTAEKCGGNLLAEGSLVSPGFPLSYQNNLDCVWDVRAPDGHVVVLTVVNLDLEDPYNCPYDWLGVAYTNTTQREITMCQPHNIGRIITSSSNFMRIFFHTDGSVTGRGFNITLSAQDGCIPAQLKVVSYNITSVTLSWIVPNDLNNTFLSFVSLFSSGKEIQNHTTNKELTITGLSPDSSYSVSISSLCNGTESIPATIDVQTGPPSPPMNLTVVEQGVGFAFVRWTAPNDPNKDNYTYHVAWYQYEYRKYSRTVHGTEINITSLAPGENSTVAVTSSYGNKSSLPATITFTAEKCGGNLLAEGSLVSPGFPFNYQNNLDCVWDVRAPDGHVVVLTVVNLDLEDVHNCPWDWLGVAYTNTTQREITMCQPHNIGRIITSSSNFMRIFFHTDEIITRRGFNITLSAQVPCAGKVRAEGWLSSSRYPLNMYLNMDCVWDIEAPLGHIVVLTVVDLNYYYYYSSSQCYRTWLAVGYNQTSDRDVTMCRYSDVGRRIISTSNTLRLFYHALYYDHAALPFNVTLSSQGNLFTCCPVIDIKFIVYSPDYASKSPVL
uniref:receptor-type tyrosine-protein phosphatase eta-like n=1 Tax=Myxine glutinosa TaxID=7769 RepID=UPI00358ED758